MTKRTCDCCGDEMPEDFEPKFCFKYGLRKVRVILSLVSDEGEGGDGEDICKDCARQALENVSFVEDDD